jgi:hypothetical protein
VLARHKVGKCAAGIDTAVRWRARTLTSLFGEGAEFGGWQRARQIGE